MSSSSSSGSLAMLSSPLEKISPFQSSAHRSNLSQQEPNANHQGLNIDKMDSFNRMAKKLNHRSDAYKDSDIREKHRERFDDLSLLTEPADVENKTISSQMDNALDVFFKFEDMAGSELREASEFQTERAIIREMCNVVIKKLDSKNDWQSSS